MKSNPVDSYLNFLTRLGKGTTYISFPYRSGLRTEMKKKRIKAIRWIEENKDQFKELKFIYNENEQ